MRRIAVSALCAVTLVLVPAAPPASAMANSTFDTRLRALTNEARRDHGRAALRYGRCVDRYAQRHARRMAARERLFHQNLAVVLRSCGLRAVAENVASGYRTPRANVRAWLASPGHRRNLLNRGYTRLGIGVSTGANGVRYTVQVFGRPR